MISCEHCLLKHETVGEVRACWLLTRNGVSTDQLHTRSDSLESPQKLGPDKGDAGQAKIKMTRFEKKQSAVGRMHNPSPAELALSEAMGRLESKGVIVKREYPVHGYFADFCIPRAHLIVEVDGAFHRGQIDDDRKRDQVLRSNGYIVIRFAAREVLGNTNGVVRKIEARLSRIEAQRRSETPLKKTKRKKSSSTKKKLTFDPNEVLVNADLSLSRRPPVQGQSKKMPVSGQSRTQGEFLCLHCPERRHFVSSEASPRCFSCGRSDGTKPVCRSCHRPYEFWLRQRSWRCQECSDVHSIAKEAAGGFRTDMTPLSEIRHGHQL